MDTEGFDEDQLTGLRDRVPPEVRTALLRSFELGFLGSMPIGDQIDHALGFVAVVEAVLGGAPEAAIDLGTGGGVPGLILIACWPDACVVLVDASERRTEFLQETVDGWSTARNGEVIRGRAEELGRQEGLRERFEVVTSRSFGAPALTAECGSAFLSPNGLMVVSEPPEVEPEDRWPVSGLATLGLFPQERVRLIGRFGYQVIRKVESVNDRFPRRVGIPAKRPLF
ncbi:MAG: RsmG family class I SAM-dependent methyltransferase [Acidimicrobiales bacterium]